MEEIRRKVYEAKGLAIPGEEKAAPKKEASAEAGKKEKAPAKAKKPAARAH